MTMLETNRASLRLAGILLLFALTVAFVWLMPAWLLTPDMLPAFTAGILIIAAVCITSARSDNSATTYRRLTFLLWWVLLSSEEFFVRLNETADTASGRLRRKRSKKPWYGCWCSSVARSC